MVRLTKISKAFGGQEIFRAIDWFIGPRDRVALIGANGSGKTTLLRLIAALDAPDAGTIDLPKAARVGYLAQAGFVIGEGSVRAEARGAFDEVLGIEAELRQVEGQLAGSRPGDRGLDALAVRQAELHERLTVLGADQIERQVEQVLTGLGFSRRDLERPVSDLSGGWQMRAALARILLQRPQILLLDEPTNHLDLEAREWLEGYLRDYPYAFAVVSHDRYFLDQTVKRVTEIVERGLEEYAGNYSFYEREREKRLALRQKAYERQQDEIRRVKRFIDKFRSDKKRAAQVQSRVKMLAKMERIELPREYRRSITMRYPDCPHAGKIVMELRDVHKAYDEVRVFTGADLRILRGQRVALVGPNGAGKSTLMRLLVGQEPPDRGERRPGYRVMPAFFAQEQGFRLERRRTVLETVTALAPHDFIPQVRNLLGAFLFSGDAVEKRVSVLSGGELNRLALACLLVRPSNLLLLDEPTNHLDIPAKEVLLAALRGYPGTVVFVSHDRHFLDALATHIVAVGGGTLHEYPGTYSEYLWARERRATDEGAALGPAAANADSAGGSTSPAAPLRPGDSAPAAQPPPRGRRARNGEQRRAARLAKLEEEIDRLEDRRRGYVRVMSSPDFFANDDKARVYQKEYAAVEAELAALYDEWERLHE